jgi:hypothetical protein
MRGRIINEKTIIKRNPALAFSEVDGDVLIISTKDNCCYGLGDIGSFIWNMLSEDCKLTSIIKLLTENYKVNYSKCLEDVLELLNDMLTRDLIHIVYIEEMKI